MSDPYLKGAKAQFDSLRAGRAQALAEIEAYRQGGDDALMGEAIQRLADINAAEQNLNALANQYAASQQPPPPESAEQRARKPISEMNYNDVYRMVKEGSRFGVDDDAFRAGIAEVQRRRSRGE
jgi:hypothetical protein